MTVAFQNGSYLSGSSSASVGTTYGGITVSDLYNTDYLDNKYNYTDTKEGYEIAYSGRDSAVESHISNIKSYISNAKEDKALEAYNDLLEEMKSQTRYAQLVSENGDDTQLRAIAKQLIESELDEGQKLEDFIKTNTANNFQRGLEINLDGDKNTEEDLLKEMCNYDETNRFEGLEKVGGKLCKMAITTGGGAAIGAAIGTLVGPIGAGVGAIVGGIIGLIF